MHAFPVRVGGGVYAIVCFNVARSKYLASKQKNQFLSDKNTISFEVTSSLNDLAENSKSLEAVLAVELVALNQQAKEISRSVETTLNKIDENHKRIMAPSDG